MPNPALAVRRKPQERGLKAWALVVVFAAVPLVTLAFAIVCFGGHALAGSADRVLAPAGVACLTAFLLQVHLGIAGWRNGRIVSPQNPLRQSGFWRWLLAGAFVVYLVALAVGPVPYIGWAWLAAVLVTGSLLLMPLAASPRVLERWRKWSSGQTRRRLSWLVCVPILVVACAEAGLQARKLVVAHPWLAQFDHRGAETSAATATAANEKLPARSGPFRVVILGDEAVLGSSLKGGYVARVQQMLPGLEIVPLGLGPGWSKDAGREATARLAARRPDLALAAVSIAELTRESVDATLFDWRQLELARLCGAAGVAEGPIGGPRAAGAWDDFESFLREQVPQLAACRTPVDAPMQARWRQTFASLDEMLAACRAADVEFGLLLVPGEFQVNSALRDTLLRRTGCSAAQFDVDLPQRRLEGFADGRQVRVLDLLPHLRLARQSLYEHNATDWNEQGHTVAASAIGRWLESQFGGEPALAARLSRAP